MQTKDIQTDFIQQGSIICTSCGKSTAGYYSKGDEWWDEYLEDDEKICLDCIKDRPGFREKFEDMIGLSVDRVQEII